MKNIKFTAIAIILIAGTTSSVFASWWNPTTWRIFTKDKKVSVQKADNTNLVSSSTSDKLNENNFLSCNGSKYNKCPEGQTFVCPVNGEDAFCEKNKTNEIKTPKTKDAVSTVSTSKTTTKTNTAPKVVTQTEKENFNITILSVIESLIRTYQGYADFFTKFNGILSEREQETIKTKAKIDNVLSRLVSPSEEQRKALLLLSKSRTDELEYIRLLKNNNNQNIASLENTLSLMKQYKEQKEKMFYTRDDSVKEAKELMPLYDKLDPYMDNFSKLKDGFFSYINSNDDFYNETVTTLQNKSLEDYNRALVEYNYILQQRNTVNQTSQIVLPKVELPQMPKTTYCNSSYTGIHGNYNITCTQY